VPAAVWTACSVECAQARAQGQLKPEGDLRQTSAQGSQGAHFARQKHLNEAQQGEANPALRQ
jgi:hypothetical protein